MNFVKMHGAGNDYVVIDGFQERAGRPGPLARRMCDRRFGVGSDGLILILPSSRADLRMRMFNPDGTEAEMCGNGIRCLGKLAYERGYVKAKKFTVETKAGVRRLRLIRGAGRRAQLEVGMGEPVLDRGAIPVAGGRGRCLGEVLSVGDREVTVNCLSMGNPHCVIFLDDLSADEGLTDFPVGELGPQVENHSFFPQRTNVEFVEVFSPRRIRLRTWERGAGETQACGTGAAAAVVAGVLAKGLSRRVTVEVLGGRLGVRWPRGGEVYLAGPAETVFEGRWHTPRGHVGR